MAKILIVEDDADLSETIKDGLLDEGHEVKVAGNGHDGRSFIQLHDFDVIVLDWDLPGLTGIQILKEYRSNGGQTPVIMLTGKGEIAEKEQGLDSGADDYLTKPFNLRELAARVRSLMRRPTLQQNNTLTYSDLVLNPAQFSLSRAGKPLRLLPRDFALLAFLMRNQEQVFSVETLLERVWKYDPDASAEGLRVAIRRIRKVVDEKDDPSTSVIENIVKIGYRMRPLP